MPSRLPVTLDFGTLPQTGQGYTPQQFANILGTNGAIFTEQEFALFVTGSTAPTSDVGPWLANGNEWRVWDDGSGSYVPITIDQGSLGYIISDSAPDPTIYQFWIKTAIGGSPLGLFTYYSGAWVDVYAATIGGYMTVAAFNAAIASYSTTAQMNTAITTAANTAQANAIATSEAYTDAQIAGIPGANFYPARADSSGDTNVPTNGASTIIALDSEEFDPSGSFNTGTYLYTAPVSGYYHVDVDAQITNDTGDVTGMEIQINVDTNGGAGVFGNGTSVASPPGNRWYASVSGSVHLNAGDTVGLYMTANDGVGTGNVKVGNASMSVNLIMLG